MRRSAGARSGCLRSATVRRPEYVTFHKFRLRPFLQALSAAPVESQVGPSNSVVKRRRESLHGPLE
jgi:hypothetical protein